MPAVREHSTDRSTGKRIAKACEACRVRRTKCDGATPSCSKCVEAGGLECVYRARARPSRQLRIQRPLAAPESDSPSTSSDEPRPVGMRAVEVDLERQCEAVTGCELLDSLLSILLMSVEEADGRLIDSDS